MCHEMAGVLNPRDKNDYDDQEKPIQKETSPGVTANKRI